MSESGKLIDNRFEIIEQIGTGGMGRVLKCLDTKMNKIVAVKVLVDDSTELLVARFHQEAKSISRLKHPNIVEVMDFGRSTAGELYLVLDYLKGTDLAAFIEKNGPLAADFAVMLFVQICDGLSHAHANGVLHRDIKPSNVILITNEDQEVEVKLVDFGLAKLIAKDQNLTRTGIGLGSPPYMSPEQAEGKELDHRSDIYSLGCLMFESLTGQQPFISTNPLATMLLHIKNPAPKLSEKMEGDVNPQLEQIVYKCMAKKPDDRFESASKLADELVEVIQSSCSEITSSGVYTRRSIEFVNPLSTASPQLSPLQYAMVVSPPREKPESAAKPKSLTRNVLMAVGACSLAALVWLGVNVLSPSSETDYQNPIGHEKILPLIGHKRHHDKNQTQPNYSSSRILEDTDESMKELKNLSLDEVTFFREKYKDNQLWWHAKGDAVDEDLLRFRKLKNPDRILIGHEMLTGKGFRRIADLPIAGIALPRCTITDAGLIEGISRVKSLQWLELQSCREITDRGVASLVALPQLETLLIGDTVLDDNIFPYLSKMSKLRVLDLSNCELMNGKGLGQLNHLRHLEELRLAHSGLLAHNLLELSPHRFKVLDLSNLGLTDDDMQFVSRLKADTLLLVGNPITYKGTRLLRGSRGLGEIVGVH